MNKKVIVGVLLFLFSIVGGVFKVYRNYGIYIPYGQLSIFLMTIATIAVMVGYMSIHYWNWPLHRTYLVLGLLFGFIFMMAIPIFVVPDESNHMFASYYLSNIMLGQPFKEGNNILMRTDDSQYYLTYWWDTTDWDVLMFNDYLERLWQPLVNGKLIESGGVTDKFNAIYQYLPSAIGLTIGRLLGLNTLQTFLLGRLVTLVFWVYIISLAIKIIPVGKLLMFILSLTPMMFQQMMSYSYDTFAIGLGFLIVAWTLRIFYADKTNTEIKKWELPVLALVCLLYLPTKNGAYFPVSLFSVCMYIYKKLNWPNSRWFKIIGACVGLVILAFVALFVFDAMGIDLLPESTYVVFWANEPGYTLGYLINNPSEILSVIWNTFTKEGKWFIYQGLGISLGWFEIPIFELLIDAYIFMILFAAQRRNDDTLFLNGSTKFILVVLAVLSICCIFGGMLLGWSPISAGIVQGVQGRYLIPLSIMLLLALNSKKVIIDRSVDKIELTILLFVLISVTVDVITFIQFT